MMTIRLILRIVMAIVALAALLTGVVQAGGWAVITIDNLPQHVIAGQALTLGFIVRQHGQTLRDDLTPILHFGRADAKDSFDVTAKREGASGHYTAIATFPSAGQWNWRVDIEQFGMITQDMPPFNVLTTAPAATSAVASISLPVAAGLAGFIGAALALIFWFRTRTRRALALVVMAVALSIAGLAAASGSAAFATPGTQADLADRGKALFEAKGCVMCHVPNATTIQSGPFLYGNAQPPNLFRQQYTADYLRTWLKDPAAVKPATLMPNLGLKPDEIEALIAFLHSDNDSQ